MHKHARTTPAHIANDPAKRVIRVCALPVPVFDLLKDFQREQEALTGQPLTTSETVSLIITEHAELASRAKLTSKEGK
jgi:hypothetical protein